MKKKTIGWVAAGLLLLALLVGFSFSDFSRSNSPAWPELNAAVELQPPELVFREVGPTNGFFYVNQLVREYPEGFEIFRGKLGPLGTSILAKDTFIESNPEVIGLFQQAVACSFWRGRTALDLKENVESSDCARIAASLAKMNTYRLEQAAKRGDWATFKSVFSDHSQFQGNMVKGAPSLFMSQLFSINNVTTLHAVDRVFALSDPPADVLESMAVDLRKTKALMPSYGECFRYEVLMLDSIFENDFPSVAAELPFVLRPHTPWQKRTTVKNLRAILGLMIEDSEAGFGEGSLVNQWIYHPDNKRITRRTNPAGRLLARMASSPNADKERDRYLMASLRLEAVHCAIALEQFHQTNGHYPDRIEELPYQVPVDISSLTGEPLIYRELNDSEFILYARGQNRTDDGMLGEENDDRVFHRSDP